MSLLGDTSAADVGKPASAGLDGGGAARDESVDRKRPNLSNAGNGVHRQLPHLGNAGNGVHRKLPHLRDAGKGVHRQLPHLGDAGTGVHRQLPHLGDAGTGVHRQHGAADLRAPFPWFGGKSRVAPLVWERFGAVVNYVEPFFGSGAVLLGRPSPQGVETVNDIDCCLANFWRALAADPEAVAHYADWPVNEADQHARHLWICRQAEFRERMKTDPDYYDPKIAGWWVWGQSIYIGSGWCAKQFEAVEPLSVDPSSVSVGGVPRQLPQLRNNGEDIKRQALTAPWDHGSTERVRRKHQHLGGRGDGSQGVHRKSLRAPSDHGSTESGLFAYMFGLAGRLRNVRVCCGDFARVLGPSVTFAHGLTGVFLDPPYGADADRDGDIYAADDLTVAVRARDWAVENGINPLLRIALCGYDGEHPMPDDWECVAWKAPGGYGSQSNGRGRANAGRERIWFSPHCLGARQRGLFG